jgi:hypothetical protein
LQFGLAAVFCRCVFDLRTQLANVSQGGLVF